MGAAGSTHGAFSKAVEHGNVAVALMTAREMGGTLALDDALALTAMFARVGDERFDAAAVRFLGRLAEERKLSLAGMRLAAEALAQLPDESARRALAAMIRRP